MQSFSVSLTQFTGETIEVTLSFESVQQFTKDRLYSKLGINDKEKELQIFNAAINSFQTIKIDKDLDILKNGAQLRIVKPLSKKEQKAIKKEEEKREKEKRKRERERKISGV